MTIDEAIQTLNCYLNETKIMPERFLVDAMKLGIEALKRIRLQRETIDTFARHQLPGETKE